MDKICLMRMREHMNDKIITALLAILIALGGWTLSRTFSLSQDMVLIKEKVSWIEDEVSDFKTFKKKKKRKGTENTTRKAYYSHNFC